MTCTTSIECLIPVGTALRGAMCAERCGTGTKSGFVIEPTYLPGQNQYSSPRVTPWSKDPDDASGESSPWALKPGFKKRRSLGARERSSYRQGPCHVPAAHRAASVRRDERQPQWRSVPPGTLQVYTTPSRRTPSTKGVTAVARDDEASCVA